MAFLLPNEFIPHRVLRSVCIQILRSASEIIVRGNLHIQLQDMKCKTSNQLNGFERQIFGGRVLGWEGKCGGRISEVHRVVREFNCRYSAITSKFIKNHSVGKFLRTP